MAKNIENNKKRPKLVSSLELIFSTAVVVIVLYFLFPKDSSYSDINKIHKQDSTSVKQNTNPVSQNTNSVGKTAEIEDKIKEAAEKEKIEQNNKETEELNRDLQAKTSNLPETIKYTPLQSIEILISQNKIDAALAKLSSYHKQHPDDEYALRRAIQVALYAKNDELARKWLKEAWSKNPNDKQLSDNVFSLVWLSISKGDYTQALDDLHYWESAAESNPAEYYSLHAQCLNNIDDKHNEAIFAYNGLRKFSNSELSDSEKEKMAYAAELTGNSLNNSDKAKAIDMYELAWELGRRKQCVLNGLSVAVAINDQEKINSFIDISLKNSSVFGIDYMYWLKIADIKRNDNEETANIYVERAIAVMPQNTDAVLYTGWYLINRYPEYEKSLEKFLLKHSDFAKDKPELWDMYIAGWNKLKNYDKALACYERAEESHKNDLKWIYNYSTLMQTAGYNEEAALMKNNLAKYGFTNKALAPLDSTSEDIVSDLLFRNFKNNGLQAFNQSMDTLAKANPDVYKAVEKKALLQAADYCTQTNDFDQLDEIHSQLQKKSIKPPVWQRVALANNNNDKKELREIIEDEDSLDIPLKVLVLQKLGKHKEAVELAKNANIEGDENKTQQLRTWGKYLSAETPSGTQTIAHFKDFYDVQSYSLSQSYDRLMKFGTIGISVAGLKLIGNEYLQNDFNNEFEVKANVRLYNKGKPTWIEGAYLYRQNGSNFAIAAKQSIPINNRLSTEFNLWWNQRGQITGFTYALTKNDAVKLSSVYQFTQRINLVFDASWHQYRSLWGKHLAHGPTLQSTLIYKLFAQAPSLWFWTEGLWVQLYSIDELPTAITDYYPGDVPLPTSLFPENYAHVYFGFTYNKSYPGLLVHTAESPHWVIKPFVGYNIYGKTIDWGVTLGVGTKIFGNDELSILGAYSSSSFIGVARKEIKLQYNINF